MNKIISHFFALFFCLIILAPAARAQQAANNAEISLQLAVQVADFDVPKAQMKEQMLGTFSEMFTNLLLKENPGKEKLIANIVDNEVPPVVDEAIRNIVMHIASMYAQNFSTEELSQMVAYQNSSLGKKVKAFNETLEGKISSLSEAAGRIAVQKAAQAVVNRARENGLQIPK
jgi:hypothetical protein